MKIGMTAIQVVCEIAKRNKNVAMMRFGVYRPGKFAPLSLTVEKKAKRLRRLVRLHGYWQSVLTVCWQDRGSRRELLRAVRSASKHKRSAGLVRSFDLKRKLITEPLLRDRIAKLKGRESLFVSSEAKLVNGKWVHFPMMDFTCYDTDHDLRKVVFAISATGLKPGVVLRSGKSFHFYGWSPMTPTKWLRFLGRCLLLVPISDARYIGHRMIDGACTLRLSSRLDQANMPTLAATVH